MNRRSYFQKAKRIVVKVGSNVLTADRGLNLDIVRAISRQVCQLIDSGLQVILVSSGAMAAGMKKVGLPERPVENVTFINNTVYDNGTAGWGAGFHTANSDVKNIVVRNNLFS